MIDKSCTCPAFASAHIAPPQVSMCRPPIGVIVDPRQPEVGLQHAFRHLVSLTTEHTEDAKVIHDETGK